ncbi:MAG: phosphoribosylformylglycinamidine cyclo-ligase [Bdellovibrionales bacterium]
MDYKQAGVDVAAGDALVDWLKATQPQKFPHQDKIVSGIGGFAALFRADFLGMKEPCLVSCTDGVGTKVKLAAEFGRYREVAQDLVAMCVNDMICCGARPLFFLDYYATGKLDLKAAQDFLGGVREACHQSDCALIGGETAEMPGVYQAKDFDCAGFSVGVVDKPKALGPARVSEGDRLLGFASSGFHSNGYSLLRKVFEKDLTQWADVLLRPTALYVKPVLELVDMGGVNALAHITGGGLDNLPRILPNGMVAEISPWVIPAEFSEVQRRSKMTWEQMVATLNCGMGMIAVVQADHFAGLLEKAEALGLKPADLGVVVKGATGEEASWRLKKGAAWRGAEL